MHTTQSYARAHSLTHVHDDRCSSIARLQVDSSIARLQVDSSIARLQVDSSIARLQVDNSPTILVDLTLLLTNYEEMSNQW